MKLLDLFCCEGGAGMGYAMAGFDITGVDINYYSRNPHKLIVGDAMEFLDKHGKDFDFIHASPPCQGYSHLTPKDHKEKYPKLIPLLRDLLTKIGKPYVIENVAGAKGELVNPLMLCGSMFKLRCQRHRYFETSFSVIAPRKCDHSRIPLLVTTASKASREKRFILGMKPKTVKNAPLAYGINWMSFNGLKECVPPAYTKYIAEHYLELT